MGLVGPPDDPHGHGHDPLLIKFEDFLLKAPLRAPYGSHTGPIRAYYAYYAIAMAAGQQVPGGRNGRLADGRAFEAQMRLPVEGLNNALAAPKRHAKNLRFLSFFYRFFSLFLSLFFLF